MFTSVEDRQIKTLIDFLSIFENIMASDQFQFELIFWNCRIVDQWVLLGEEDVRFVERILLCFFNKYEKFE